MAENELKELAPALREAKGQESPAQASPPPSLEATLHAAPPPARPPGEAELQELAKPNRFDPSLEAEAVGGRGAEQSYPEAAELEENRDLTGDARISSEPGHDPASTPRDADFQAPEASERADEA